VGEKNKATLELSVRQLNGRKNLPTSPIRYEAWVIQQSTKRKKGEEGKKEGGAKREYGGFQRVSSCRGEETEESNSGRGGGQG